MKKTKKLSAMLLASVITAGAVSSLSAGAMDFSGRGFEDIEKKIDGCIEISASEAELFGKSYMPDYPNATYFIRQNAAFLVEDIESSKLDILVDAEIEIEEIMKIVAEICPSAVVKEVKKDSGEWKEIYVMGYEGKLPFTEAKAKTLTFDKAVKIYKKISEISTVDKSDYSDKGTSCVEINGYLTGYRDIDNAGEKIENYIAENYPDWHMNLEYNDYMEFDEWDFSVEPDKEVTIEEHYKLANEIYKLTGQIPDLSTTAFDSDATISGARVDLHTNVKGDANDDGKLALSDAIAILQTVGNPDTYGLTAQGEYNADIAGDFDGITNLDALTVQRKLLKLE